MDGSDPADVERVREAFRSRVTLMLEPGGMTIDGVWWPRSDSLAGELPALDAALAQLLGVGIARFSYVLGTWSDGPRRVRAGGHLIKLGWFSHGAAPDHVDLSLEDYRRLVLKVIPPDTAPGEAEAFINGATVMTSRPGPRVAGMATPAAGRPHTGDTGNDASAPEAGGCARPAPDVPAVTALLGELVEIEDPRARERAARRLEWRATEWAMAAGRIRWGAHAEALESAGEPPSAASPPWG
jgi:hypothetical protein